LTFALRIPGYRVANVKSTPLDRAKLFETLFGAGAFSGDKALRRDDHADRQEKPTRTAWKQENLTGRGEPPFGRQ
jgi:hypothetical protein